MLHGCTGACLHDFILPVIAAGVVVIAQFQCSTEWHQQDIRRCCATSKAHLLQGSTDTPLTAPHHLLSVAATNHRYQTVGMEGVQYQVEEGKTVVRPFHDNNFLMCGP